MAPRKLSRLAIEAQAANRAEVMQDGAEGGHYGFNGQREGRGWVALRIIFCHFRPSKSSLVITIDWPPS
jgi:hypothetical protein